MEPELNEKPKTSTGLDENIGGLLAYVLGFVSGIVFLLIEKENQFIRFHALQSIIVFGSLAIVNFVLGFIPIVSLLSGIIIPLIIFVLWVVLIFKAYKGEKYKLPIAGDIAEQQLAKLGTK
ncbi:DUF4870 domain-containing protein [Alkalihalobacterium alkalicellulosilyticum]|uniref:DUF4870 domain-containing protein n=1 Tax=Alkalihalobacterium alkalicellulosilyticum TaxID=1912214 RepID=UPI003AF1A442